MDLLTVGSQVRTYFNKSVISYRNVVRGCKITTPMCKNNPALNGTVKNVPMVATDNLGQACVAKAYEIETAICGNPPGSRNSSIAFLEEFTREHGPSNDMPPPLVLSNIPGGPGAYAKNTYRPLISSPAVTDMGQIKIKSQTTKTVSIGVKAVNDNFGTSDKYKLTANQSGIALSPNSLVSTDAKKVSINSAACSGFYLGSAESVLCTIALSFDSKEQLGQISQKLSVPVAFDFWNGSEWKLESTATVLVEIRGSVVENTYPWQNPKNPLDVDGDNSVSPLDVLALINELNTNGSRQLDANGPVQGVKTFFDVDGDGSISPLDVLGVINFLNTQT